MDWKWNHIRVKGDKNLVLQDADGNATTIAITAFIEQFSKEKDDRIRLLYERLSDKEKIEQFAEAERYRMQAELQQLQKEKIELEKRITTLLQEFNNKDITNTDALYQEAFALFMNGKVDDALGALDEARLEAREKELEKERKKQAETRILKAELLQLKFDFKGASEQFDRALSIDSSWIIHMKAAGFYQFLNDFPTADKLYQQALALADSSAERAATLNNLANLHRARNDFEAAEKGFQEALAIRRTLSRTNPDTYRPHLASTLNNLALLHRDRNDFEAAEKGFQEALKIYRELSRTNPDTYRPDVAMTLINLGIFYQDAVPDKDRSLAYIVEALRIVLPLQEKIPSLERYVAVAVAVLQDWEMDPKEIVSSLQ